MKRILVITVLMGLQFGARAQDFVQHYADSLAEKYLHANHHLALVIGVNQNGEERIFTYGETEKGSRVKPDDKSVFEIGQITQVFTSVLYADMSTKGLIGADDPVQIYLPVDVASPVYQPLVCKPAPRVSYKSTDPHVQDNVVVVRPTPYVCYPDPSINPQPILLCYLSTHTSGLPDLPSNLKSKKKNPYAGYTKEMMYDFLRTYSLSSPIGYDFRFSNFGIAVLGHAMELKAKKSYESLLNERILQPLSMTSTKVNVSATASREMLTGHKSNGKAADAWTFDVMAPCAGLHSNLNDMMRFLAANVGTSQIPLKGVLDYTHNLRILFHNKKYGEASSALGWIVSQLEEETPCVWQEGLTGGFASFIGFDEAAHTGVVILSNSAIPVTDMGKELLRRVN